MIKSKLFVIFSVALSLLITFIYAYDAAYYPIAYAREISQYSREFGADEVLITSIINSESGFNPRAVSSYGAIGLMQLIPSTALLVAIQLNEKTYSEERLFEPELNIKFGTFYFVYLLEKFNSVSAALASYNAGEGVVSNWLKSEVYSPDGVNLRSSPYPATNAYMDKVALSYDVYKTKLTRAVKRD